MFALIIVVKNADVGFLMRAHRGANRGISSIIQGSSVHNQRIERGVTDGVVWRTLITASSSSWRPIMIQEGMDAWI